MEERLVRYSGTIGQAASKDEFEEIGRLETDCFFFLDMVVCRRMGRHVGGGHVELGGHK